MAHASLRVPLHVVLAAAVGSAACSVASVSFTPLGESAIPDASAGDAPGKTEDCAAPGDEDGNGAEGCGDPACADAPACQAAKPVCGDRQLDTSAGEEVDPPLSPSTAVPVNDQTCRYDFSAINQLSCLGTCGAWGGGDDCQQEDADALCKLRTGNPSSTASTFTIESASDAPGICCAGASTEETHCVELGRFDDRGVPLMVAVHETSLVSTHGPGAVVANVTCTNL